MRRQLGRWESEDGNRRGELIEYYVPGTSHMLFHVILLTFPCRCCNCLHFAEQRTDTQRGEIIHSKVTSRTTLELFLIQAC